MQVNYRAYPHPVLSYFSDDYVRCLYQTNILTTVSRSGYVFSVMSKTSSSSLNQLLASGEATHAVHIECAATRFRQLFTSQTDAFSIEVANGLLEGRVYICSFIVAAKDIEFYSSTEFHADFGGRGFSIKKGDVLAVDKDRNFAAENEYDPLRKLPSIFTIVPSLVEGAPAIDVDSDNHKVVIRLSHEVHEIYKKLSADSAMAHILSSMVVVPALISLLETMTQAFASGDTSDLEARRWYRVLLTKLKDIGYPIEESVEGFSDSTLVIAQKLIGQPLLLGVRGLKNLIDDSGDEE